MKFFEAIKELYTYRHLIKQLAYRDLKARYKVSILGFFWSLIRPLLTIAVLAVIFSYLLDLQSISYDVPYYILLLATYMPWFYLSSTLLEGVQSLVANANLIQKVYCPRSVFPAAVVLANLINFFFSLLVVIPVIFLLSGARPTGLLLQLPLVIVVHTAFLLGLSMISSVLNVLFRDTTQLMEFFVFVWFYLSPVLYDVAHVFEKVKSDSLFLFYFLNPMAGILEWYRYVLLSSTLKSASVFPVHIESQQTIIIYVGIPFAVAASVGILFLGCFLFKKLETRAVDTL